MSKYYDDARIALLMLDWYGVKYAPKIIEKVLGMLCVSLIR